MAINTLLIAGALISFGLEVFGVSSRINLTALGLFLLTLTLLI